MDLDEVMQMSGGKATDTELVPLEQGAAEPLSTLDVPEYEPGDPSYELDAYEKGSWERQDRVLRAFAKCRTKSIAARMAGVGTSTVFGWIKADHLGFKSRLEEADQAFTGELELLALNRVRAQKPGDNPTLLIMLLNGNLPDKYRPNSVIPSETMTETLRAMKQATREHRKMQDGSETTTETETTVIIKKGLTS